jgi:hypothetical protein
LTELDEEDIRVYRSLCRHVQQFRSNPMTMDLKDLDVVTEQLEKPYMKLLDDLTPAQVLARFAPAELLACLTPEQIIEALPPEALEAIRRMKS